MRVYENMLKTSENRLKQRSYYIPQGKSEYKLLNGDWRFAYYDRDIDVPENITNWDIIPVPSCWQLHGYENPNYTNVNYPYPFDPPYVPDDNPCGVYERDFEIEELWGKVYFVLEGVASCAFVYLNDNYVGFTQGSHLQAEFDITEYAKKGKNTLRVKVLKWCVGSYLEDQDFFRFNGIFRDCYILQRPIGHITDLHITAKDNCISVVTDADAEVCLYDTKGELIGTKNGSEVCFKVENPVLWNAEKPALYTVKLAKDGEVITQETGFRTIEISPTLQLLINGVSVKLYGVNHHDTHPTNGWCQTNEELEKDLLLMKDLNINCIRTSHYPPTPYFLELCDRLGFYVILETDIETHGVLRRLPNKGYGFDVESEDWPGTNPQWLKEHMERMERAVYRDRNHASIIMWSSGNESGHGPNHKVMIDWLRGLGDGRLAHCEDACRKGENEYSDVCSRMYLAPATIEGMAEDDNVKTPIFMCEYAHAMGNGPGDPWDYSEAFDRHDKLIGGCVWEWADHTVVVDGVQKYGGDFEGELTHDGNFCCDGMVFSDRSLKAGSLEVKAAYQPMVTSFEDGVLKVRNRLNFTNLNEYEFTYRIELDGNQTESKTLALDIKPHATAEIKLDLPVYEGELGAYIICTLSKDGKEYAITQHELPFVKREEVLCADHAEFAEDEREIIAKGKNFEYAFSKHYGNFTSLKVDGRENLADTIKLSAWRAPTDNDRNVKVYWGHYNIWQGENLNLQFSKIYDCKLENGTITVRGALAGVSLKPYFIYTLKYDIFADGRIEVSLNGDVREDAYWLPRLGFEIKMPADNDKFSYFGFGPNESYCDMHHGSVIGQYSSDADSEYVNYVRPQEHGNHFGVKKLEIGNLVFEGDAFETNVSRFDGIALENANHTDELQSDGYIHTRIDYKVSGIGSNSCGPLLIEKYRLTDKEINFNFSIKIKRA